MTFTCVAEKERYSCKIRTKFCEISALLLSTVHTDKSKLEISLNFVAFSEYMNFKSKSRVQKSMHLVMSLACYCSPFDKLKCQPTMLAHQRRTFKADAYDAVEQTAA